MKLLRHTSLRFKKDKSDKVYEVDLLETGGDYLVHFRYGRFGANLREGCKTKSPVDLSQATKIADSLLVSKINKGYYVDKGYDPLKREAIDDQASQTTPQNNASRTQKIIARLEKFAQAKDNTIDGYALGRTLWKAGELRISPIAPIIKKLLAASLDEPATTYYAMLWALGREGDEQGLALVDSLKNKLPKHTDYMLTEVKLALAPQAENLIPEFDRELDILASATKVALFNDIEKMSFETLETNQREFINHVMALRGITQAVETALEQLTIEDFNKDDEAEYIAKYLPKEIANNLEEDQAAYPKLEEAIDNLLEHQKNQLIDQKLLEYQSDFELYQSLINQMNLPRVLGDDYYIETVKDGRLEWIWGSEKKRLRKTLIAALKKAGSDKNIQSFWQRVVNYADIKSNQYISFNTDQVAEFNKIIAEANVADDVNQALQRYSLNEYSYSFKRDNLSADTRAKYEDSAFNRVRELFHDKFHALRAEALKPKTQLLKQFQQTVLGTYWQSLINPATRSLALIAIKNTPVKAPFTQTFRRLYKMAEFRDDAEVLAILNHCLESTAPSQNNYWQAKKKPFSKATKAYFRKRMVRRLQHIAKFNPKTYTQAAKHILLQADDSEKLAQVAEQRQLTHFPRLHALNFILHKNSRIFSKNYINIWSLSRNKRTQEATRPEAYAELWNKAEEDLFALLLGCKAQLVNDFSYARLEGNQSYLKNVTQQDWIILVQKPYENTALLGLTYLTDALTDIAVMKAILSAKFSSVRAKALQVLDGESLGENPDLLVLMLLSEHNDVYDFATRYLYTAQAHYQLLSDQFITALLDNENNNTTTKEEGARLLARIEWLLLHPLKSQASLDKISSLLAHQTFELQFLAAKLLEVSAYTFAEMEDSYQLMSQSNYPEIRAGAIALLTKLPQQEQIKQQQLLLDALLDEHGRLREKSRQVVITIDDQAFRTAVFDHVLPSFFKAEPVEGFSDDMLELVVGLEPLHADIDSNLLWRLLNAKSKLAEWVGAIILPARTASEFSVKQLALLSKNSTLTVRDWALDAFAEDLSLTTENYSQAISILDNRWDDSRSRAIDFFKARFDQNFWDSKRTIAVCDNVYADVQKFGRDLVTRFFQQDQGEEYLLKLSQHPSANVQLFVSGFLKEYASDQSQIILSLAPYFKTVLSQVNRGRLVKDRVIRFLFDEAIKNAEVATMVAELFSDQSISRVIVDKMQYIKTLFKLQTQFKQIKTPVVIIKPEVRAL